MASEAELVDPFNQAFDKIKEGIKQAVDRFNELVGKVQDKWWMFSLAGAAGAAAALYIKHGLDTCRDALEQLIEKVNYAVEHQTPVLSLIIASFKWISQVETPVSEMSTLVNRPENENLAKWTGDASTSYRIYKLPEQKGAVDDAVAKAQFISKWLFTIAKSNVEYAVKMAEIVVKFVESIVALVAKAATVVGIAEAAGELGDLAGQVVKDGFTALTEIGMKLLTTLGDVRDLWSEVGNHSKLLHGKWPEAVVG